MSRAAVAALALAGCASTLESTSARTLAPGAWETSAALGAGGAAIVDGDRSPPGPLVEAGIRRGVSSTVDVGAKIFEAGAEVDAKVQLVRSDRGWSVAVEPGVGYLFPVLAAVYSAELPVLAGYTFDNGDELVFGPRALALLGHYDRADMDVALGGTIGYAWKLSSRWRVMPEITASRTVRDPVWAAAGGLALIRTR